MGLEVQGHRVGDCLVFGEDLMTEKQTREQVCVKGTHEPESGVVTEKQTTEQVCVEGTHEPESGEVPSLL